MQPLPAGGAVSVRLSVGATAVTHGCRSVTPPRRGGRGRSSVGLMELMQGGGTADRFTHTHTPSFLFLSGPPPWSSWRWGGRMRAPPLRSLMKPEPSWGWGGARGRRRGGCWPPTPPQVRHPHPVNPPSALMSPPNVPPHPISTPKCPPMPPPPLPLGAPHCPPHEGTPVSPHILSLSVESPHLLCRPPNPPRVPPQHPQMSRPMP